MLEVRNLCIQTKNGKKLLNDICLQLKQNECIGLTGASGSGKSTLIKAIMGMYGENWNITSGEVLLEGASILKKTSKGRRLLCGVKLGFIPQNPMTSFFPNARVGKQIIDIYMKRLNFTKKEAEALAKKSLPLVNLNDTYRIMNAFPKQLSGGMLQRVIVAITLGLKPQYILADEPTSALDEENRDILLELLKERREAGILFVSHDVFGLQTLCSKIAVVQDGKIVEKASTKEIFSRPTAKWTKRFVSTVKESKKHKWEWIEL